MPRIPPAPRPIPTTFTLALALATGCVAEDELDPEDLAELDPEDLAEQFRVHYGAMANHFEIVQDDAMPSKATGAIHVPLLAPNGDYQYVDGKLVRGTCGATFVSPHYAVTAAHCVKEAFIPDPTNGGVWMTTYDASAAPSWMFFASGVLYGTFPDYTPAIETYDIPGFQIGYHWCTVTSRCGEEFGPHNCGTLEADIALLHCSSRASGSPWIPIASTDTGVGDVEMYWYHELLQMPLTDPGAGDPEGRSRFQHYTQLASHASNYHYLDAPGNGLLPLRSKPWPDGTPRRRNGTSTDLFGCHGTSGSGVLQRNALGVLELVGPALTGSWGNFLCANPATISKGNFVIGIGPLQATRDLQSLFAWTLSIDRNPFVWQPWPPGPPVFDPDP